MWKTTLIDGKPALVLSGPSDITGKKDQKEAVQQRLHDLKGAVRTLNLALELGAFDHLGKERAEALGRAIQILSGEAKFLVEAYAADW